jgi:hypothetical protein
MQEFPGALPQDAIDYIEQKWGFDWKNWSALDETQRLVLTTAVQNALAHNMSVTTKAVLDELEAGLDNIANTSGNPVAHMWPPHWAIPQDAIDRIEQKWGFDWKNWSALDATQRLALTTAIQKIVARCQVAPENVPPSCTNNAPPICGNNAPPSCGHNAPLAGYLTRRFHMQ